MGQRVRRVERQHRAVGRQRFLVALLLPERLGHALERRRIARLQRPGAAQQLVRLPVTVLVNPQVGQIQQRSGVARVELQSALEVLRGRVEPAQLA